jgi:hypothetical protein
MDNAVAYLQQATQLAPDVVAHRVELGNTYVDLSQWKNAETEFAHALAMPKSWVTDDFYKNLAKEQLKRVQPHLK